MALLALWHLQLINCDDISLHTATHATNSGAALPQNPGPGGLGSTGLPNGQNLGIINQGQATNLNQLAGNSTLLNTLMNGNGNPGLSGLSPSMGGVLGSVGAAGGHIGHSSGGSISTHGGGGLGAGGGGHHGHALAGLANLGIIVPGQRINSGGTNVGDGGGRYNPSFMGVGSMDGMIGGNGMQQGGGSSSLGGTQY